MKQYSGSFGLDFGLELAFVVTKFPQKVRVKGITNWSFLVNSSTKALSC